MSELNPNHPTTASLRGQWHKVAAALVAKMAVDESGPPGVVITAEDLARIDGLNIVAQELPDGLHLMLVDGPTAAALARQHGGLPS